MEISGHSQVFQHVMSNFERTNDFIEQNADSEEAQDEIKDKILQDLSSTLVLILDNLGRQKAIQALEIYKEHEKFRKQLEAMQEEPAQNGFDAPDKQIDSMLLSVDDYEEEKKERRQVSKRSSAQ